MTENGRLLKNILEKMDSPSKPRRPKNQWQDPGEITTIPSPYITMEGVSYPVYGVGDNGQAQMMYPNQQYYFRGASSVTEYPMMAGGGYVVTRSSDRKGKTHKVTGPDGTVKYFGDSKMGQHPKDPERKKAFYARHKSNLENNPYFRAFARKTWAEGGDVQTSNDREMVNGIADILSQVNDRTNRAAIADNMVRDFNQEGVTYNKEKFYEMSQLEKGGEMIRRADGSYSRRGLWDNIRANKGSGKEPTKEMLEQEKKINMKKYQVGGVRSKNGWDASDNPGFNKAMQDEWLSRPATQAMFAAQAAAKAKPKGHKKYTEADMSASLDAVMAQQNYGHYGFPFAPALNPMMPPTAQGLGYAQPNAYPFAQYANGGTSNEGFQALPPYVQAKIKANMAFGGYYNPYMANGGSTFSGNAWYQEGGEAQPTVDPKTYADAKNTYYSLLNKQGQRKIKDKGELQLLSDSHKVMTDNMRFYEKGKYFTTEPFVDAASQIKNTFRGIYNDMTGRNYGYGGMYQDGGEPQMEDFPDYNSYQAALAQYMANYDGMPAGADSAVVAAQPVATPVAAAAPVVETSKASSLKPYKGVSIVDFLSAQGLQGNYASRKELAKNLGIANYRGTATQNMELMQKLQSGDGLKSYKYVAGPAATKKQSVKTGAATTAKETPVSATPAVSPNDFWKMAGDAYYQNNPGAQDMSAYAQQATVGTDAKPKPYTARTAAYDDSYMLKMIENDPHTIANVRKEKRKEFAKQIAAGVLAPLAAEAGLGWATTRYLPYFANQLPAVSSFMGRALPAAQKMLPAAKPLNWVTKSGKAFAQGGPVKGSVMEVTPQEAEALRAQGYQFEIVD